MMKLVVRRPSAPNYSYVQAEFPRRRVRLFTMSYQFPRYQDGKKTMDRRAAQGPHHFLRRLLAGLILMAVIAIVVLISLSRGNGVPSSASVSGPVPAATGKLAFRPREK